MSHSVDRYYYYNGYYYYNTIFTNTPYSISYITEVSITTHHLNMLHTHLTLTAEEWKERVDAAKSNGKNLMVEYAQKMKDLQVYAPISNMSECLFRHTNNIKRSLLCTQIIHIHAHTKEHIHISVHCTLKWSEVFTNDAFR